MRKLIPLAVAALIATGSAHAQLVGGGLVVVNISNVAGVETSHTTRPSATTLAGTRFLAARANI